MSGEYQPTPRGRILLVEDDPDTARFILHVLGDRAGFDIEHAPTPVAALRRIGSGRWDLVITDVEMPDMTGIELLAELRREGITVPFGFVTSESAGEIRRRALEVGADFVVTKPFTGDDLSRQLDLALGGGGQGSTVGTGITGEEQTVADGT